MIPRMPLRTGPLIGRDTDLSRLADAIGLRPTPGARPGGVVVLSGDAGIGKSRIVGSSSPMPPTPAGSPPSATASARPAAASPTSPSSSSSAPSTQAVPTSSSACSRRTRASATCCPAAVDAPDGQGAERAGRATDPGQVAEAVHALLTALGDAQPCLVVIEDVHWADHSSRDLITLLLTRGFTTAVGLVVTYRSDDLHRRHPLHETLAVWARIAGLEHVELAPLPDDAVRELVSGIEGAPTDAGTATEIARRAEGNPFFAEELVASAAAGQALTGGLGRVLRARVEQLDDTTQRVLRAIALKGGQFIGHDLLSRVVDLPDEALEAALAAAVEHHVLEARWPPAYTFRHALLGEAVADSLLPGERLRLHRAYAATLAERPELAPASELARHAAAVGDLPTAVRASRAAAESAMAVGGPQEALLHFERALSWLDEDDAERDEVTLGASRAATVAGEPIRAIDLLRDRLDHPGTAQQPGARAVLLATLVIRSRILDLPVDSVALTDEALSLVGEQADERRVRVLVARVQALVDNGSFVKAAVVADEVSLLAERLGLGGALTEVRTIMARVVEAQEDLDSVEAHLRSVVADIPPDDPLLLRALHQLASLAHRRGDLPGSLALYDRGAEVARRMHREWAPWGQECRLLGGLTAYELGDWDGVVRRLDLAGRPAPQPGRAIFTGGRPERAGRSGRAGRPRPPRCPPAMVARRRDLRRADDHACGGRARSVRRPARTARPDGGRRARPRLDLGRVPRHRAARRARRRAGGRARAERRPCAPGPGPGRRRRPRRPWPPHQRAAAGGRESEPTHVRALRCRIPRGHEPRDLGVDGPARGRAPASPAGRRRRRPTARGRARRRVA